MISRHSRVALVISACTALALGASGVVAQTAPSPATSSTQTCAVSTARVGSLDITEFYGVGGGASTFAQNFGAASQTDATVAERCIRLEVENPSPGDLVPVGGYKMAGYAFDPTPGASAATQVQVFLDDPNQGGAIIGQAPSTSSANASAAVGLASARGAAFGDQFANTGFQLTVQIPASAAGSTHAVFVTAQFGTGRVGTVAVPVAVGNLTPAVPTRTP